MAADGLDRHAGQLGDWLLSCGLMNRYAKSKLPQWVAGGVCISCVPMGQLGWAVDGGELGRGWPLGVRVGRLGGDGMEGWELRHEGTETQGWGVAEKRAGVLGTGVGGFTHTLKSFRRNCFREKQYPWNKTYKKVKRKSKGFSFRNIRGFECASKGCVASG